jgi:hypothetical protein
MEFGTCGPQWLWHTARRGELAEHKPQAVFIVRDLRVNLGIGAFKIGAGIERWTSVPRTGNEDDVGVMLFDEPVQVNVDEVLPRRGAPVAEKPWLDLLCLERQA